MFNVPTTTTCKVISGRGQLSSDRLGKPAFVKLNRVSREQKRQMRTSNRTIVPTIVTKV